MKRIALVCAMMLCLGALMPMEAPGEEKPAAPPEAAEQAPEQPPSPAASPFPIEARLETPRAYGYFIGDEIPLQIEIEVEAGMVVDLVNLPREGEQHGALEVRTFDLTSVEQANGRQLYRVNYRLQYFGATPLTLKFEPLELLYAPAQNRDAVSQRYVYKSLFTQPLTFDISRIGPYRPTAALDPKGPLSDARPWRIWIAVALGGLCVLTAIGGGVRDGWRYYQEQRGRLSGLHSVAAQTLARLKREEERRAPSPQLDAAPVGALGGIMRDYLQHAWRVSAYTLTPSELAARLEDSTPEVQDVLSLLQQCDTLKYQPETPDEEEHVLWDEAVTLFEQMDGR